MYTGGRGGGTSIAETQGIDARAGEAGDILSSNLGLSSLTRAPQIRTQDCMDAIGTPRRHERIDPGGAAGAPPSRASGRGGLQALAGRGRCNLERAMPAVPGAVSHGLRRCGRSHRHTPIVLTTTVWAPLARITSILVVPRRGVRAWRSMRNETAWALSWLPITAGLPLPKCWRRHPVTSP